VAITASKLGSAPITIDWSALASVPPKVGPTARTHEPDPQELEKAWESLKSRFQSEVGFYNAPIDPSISQVEPVKQLATKLRNSEKFSDCLVLGIGGSALGPLSLLQALQKESRPNFYFMENPDPIVWTETLHRLRPESTLVIVITKSGGTIETISQMMLALDWLGKPNWKSNLVAITDPSTGDLREFSTSESITSLEIHPSIGGRFSVFSPVGLFPAALAGLSTGQILEGAKKVRDYCEKTPVIKNPLFILGSHFIQNFEARPIHVCMPYSSKLKKIGAWWTQLWGESLGKDAKGFTPLSALGAVDQHSILQLLRDGPDDKITFFVTVDRVENPVTIPRSQAVLSSFKLLEKHSLHELLNVEYSATAKVLTRQSRPNITIKLDNLDEASLGAFYFALSVLTAFTGTLWGVNPFDQPGVEEGKTYAKEALRS
jgi:glucose-6-phosphate isomerase